MLANNKVVTLHTKSHIQKIKNTNHAPGANREARRGPDIQSISDLDDFLGEVAAEVCLNHRLGCRWQWDLLRVGFGLGLELELG